MSLHELARWGWVERVRKLLRAGANVNEVDKDGDTPLHKASSKGQVDVVRVLVEAGADASVAGEDGRNPWHRAVEIDNLTLLTTH